MKVWIKSICFVFVVAVVMSFANQKKAEAIQLPVLNFGDFGTWDGTSLTNLPTNPIVQSVFYQDGTFDFHPGSDPVLGANVVFDISFDGNDGNDTFGITGFFNATIANLNDSIDITNGFTVNLGSLTPTGASGRWWDEFSAKIDPAQGFYGTVIFDPVKQLVGTTYEVSGKLSPVPEPGTIALLGIGLAGLVGVGVRRRMKKKVD